MELFRVIAHDPCCNEYTFDSQSNAKMCGGFIRLATPDEIKVHLMGLAKKKYKEGDRVVPPGFNGNDWVILDTNYCNNYYPDSDKLGYGSLIVYNQGVWAEKVTEKAGLFVPKEIGLCYDVVDNIIFGNNALYFSICRDGFMVSCYKEGWRNTNTGTNYRITDEKPERGDLIYRGGDIRSLDAYGFYLGNKECVLVYGRGVLYGASGQEKKIIKV